MPEATLNMFNNAARSEWVRLRTLILLRWLATIGQTLAVLVAVYGLGLELDIGLCLLVIGLSVVFNLIAIFVMTETRLLSERNTALTLLFDLTQLSVLLYLTGGLSNPFALLILAPVTISATVLTRNSTILLSAAAIAAISLLAAYRIPLRSQDGVEIVLPPLFLIGNWVALIIGIVFLGGYARRVTIETFSMSQALSATQMALEREHKLTALGGVVAAAAHELGTPLATVKLVSAELAEELKDDPDLYSDAMLIHSQADRCREILKDMGRSGKDDLHVHHAPLTTLVHEAAEPHEFRGKTVKFLVNGEPEIDIREPIPHARRNPEVLHGLRNLVQNAVDFADTNVWILTSWSERSIRMLVCDDGGGYPPELLGRIGDPFLSTRNSARKQDDNRPEYEGMGLGLFIAKTLLERSGAELTFTNGTATAFAKPLRELPIPNAKGAIVSVRWPREVLEVSKSDIRRALGPNQPVEAS